MAQPVNKTAKPKKLKPVHPGEILSEDFMKPYGLSMNKPGA
jgi:plasmid maintenance system antidote protein VapI